MEEIKEKMTNLKNSLLDHVIRLRRPEYFLTHIKHNDLCDGRMVGCELTKMYSVKHT